MTPSSKSIVVSLTTSNKNGWAIQPHVPSTIHNCTYHSTFTQNLVSG